MENKITLNDLLNKTPEEIVPSITVDNKPSVKEIKTFLKWFFKDNKDSIKSGYQLGIDDNILKVTKVLPSTGRVFLVYNNIEFSVTKDFLTGEVTELPFEIGDEVLDLKTNEIGTVTNLIKSSRKAYVDFTGRITALPISRLRKMEKE